MAAELQVAPGGHGPAEDAADTLRRAIRAGIGGPPKEPAAALAIVSGSGLAALAAMGRELAAVNYEAIPGLGGGAVAGHEGCWRLLEIEGVRVHILSGRRHLYEGIEPAQAGFAMRLLAALGTRRVILTNAAGGLAPRLAVGDLMLIADHINMMARDPLRGSRGAYISRVPHAPRIASAAYSGHHSGSHYEHAMNDALRRAALESGIELKEGIYAAMLGPNYETRAEVRMLQMLGADAVGMSTVPEGLEAHSLGLRVAAISLIANTHAAAAPATHEEVLESGRRAVPRLIALLRRAIPDLARLD